MYMFRQSTYRRLITAAVCVATFLLVTETSLAQSPLRDAYFVEHGIDVLIRNGHSGEILSLAAVNEQFRTGRLLGDPPRLPDVGAAFRENTNNAAQIKSLAEIINANVRAGDRDVQALATALAAVPLPVARRAAAIYGDILKGGTELPNLTVAAATRFSQDNLLEAQARRELTDALSFAANNAAYRQAFNAHFQPLLLVSTSATTVNILRNNAALPVHDLTLAVSRIRSADPQVLRRLAAGAVQDVDLKRLAQAAGVSPVVFDTTRSIIDLYSQVQRLATTDPTRSPLLVQLTEKQNLLASAIRDANISMGLATSLLGLINRDLANTFSAASASFLRISNSISRFAAGNLGALALTGNLIGALLSTTSILGGGDAAMYSYLNQQFDRVHEHIDLLQNLVLTQFENVNKNLNAIYVQMQSNFRLMADFFNRIDNRLNLINDALTRNHLELMRIEEDLDTRFRSLSDEDRLIDSDECLLFVRRFPDRVIPFEKFSSCVSHFATWAKVLAADEIHTGTLHQEFTPNRLSSPPTIEAATRDLAAADRELNKPGERVQLLAGIASSFGIQRLMQGHTLSNANVWLAGSEAYLKMLSDWHASYPTFDPAVDLVEMIHRGKDIDAATTAITSDANGRKTDLLITMIEKLQEAANDVDSELEAIEVHVRDARHVRSKVSEFDVWGAPDQQSLASLSNISAQPRFVFFNVLATNIRAPLPITREIATKFVTPEESVAVALNLAVLDPEWVLTLRSTTRPTGCFRIQFRFAATETSRNLPPDQPVSPLSPGVRREAQLCGFRNFADQDALPRQDLDRRAAEAGANAADFIVQNWGTGQNLSGRFANDAVILRPETAIQSAISGAMVKRGNNAQLNVVRRELASELLSEVSKDSGPLHDALTRYAAIRKMLVAYLELGLPSSIASNDKLSGLLFGDKAVPESVDLVNDVKKAYGELATSFNSNVEAALRTQAAALAGFGSGTQAERDRAINQFIHAPDLDHTVSNPRLFLEQRRVVLRTRLDQLKEVVTQIISSSSEPEKIAHITAVLAQLEAARVAFGVSGRVPSTTRR